MDSAPWALLILGFYLSLALKPFSFCVDPGAERSLEGPDDLAKGWHDLLVQPAALREIVYVSPGNPSILVSSGRQLVEGLEVELVGRGHDWLI